MKTKSSKPRRKYRLKSQTHSLDFALLGAVSALLIIGVIMVYEASVIEAHQQFGDKTHFARLQFRWALMGVSGLLLGTFIPINIIKKLAFPSFVISVLLLIAVLIPGIGTTAGGAKRWIDLGFFSLQPSEIVKITIVLYLAALFEKTLKLAPFLISIGAVSILVMLQPDLGTTIVIGMVAFIIYFLSQAPLKHMAILASTAVFGAILLILSSTYRRERLLTFLDPQRDPLGASYHIRQIIIALGSGGLFGTGFGRSIQKFRYLPESTTDSIFAIIAEETGFMGSIIIIFLFIYITYKGLKIADSASTKFSKLVAAGMSSLIIVQAFLNLSAMAALIPLTGITLPFISYGGSSLTISLAAAGLLLNISRSQNDRS